MNKEEYFKGIEKCKIDPVKVEKVEEHYGAKLDAYLRKVISFAEHSEFIAEERRVLAFEEITTLDKDLPCDLVESGILPIMDCYDNTYIVYVIKENMWAKYNTSDQVLFKKKESLIELV